MSHVIQNKLQNPLAEALLGGKFDEGDEISVELDKVGDQLLMTAKVTLADAG